MEREDFDRAFHLPPGREAQPDGGHDPEQAVAAHDEPEELPVLRAAAPQRRSRGVDQIERFDIADDRRHRESPAVNVRGQRSAEAQPVGARLFLGDPPRAGAPGLGLEQPADELRPLDPGLHFDDPLLGVEADDALEGARVEEDRVLTELLSAHRVASAGDTDGLAVTPGASEGRPDRRERVATGTMRSTYVGFNCAWTSLTRRRLAGVRGPAQRTGERTRSPAAFRRSRRLNMRRPETAGGAVS